MMDYKKTAEEETVIENYESWPLDLQVDYILKIYHRYIRKQGPEIEKLLDKVCQAHGETYPSLYEVQKHFRNAMEDLDAHLGKEELILFPYICNMVKAKLENTPAPQFHGGSIKQPIAVMMSEHDNEYNRFRNIEQLTNGYIIPDDACNSYRLLFLKLEEFEIALHRHIHLENNNVFPKALALEAELKEES